jgi:hypothetical protein
MTWTSTLTYLHGRSLENKKKPTPVQVINSASLNSVNSVGTLDDIDTVNNTSYKIILGWTMFLANLHVVNNNSYSRCRDDYNSTQVSKFNMNVWIVNKYSQFVRGAHGLSLTYSMVMGPTHKAKLIILGTAPVIYQLLQECCRHVIKIIQSQTHALAKAPIGVWLINWLDHPKPTNGNYTHRILEPPWIQVQPSTPWSRFWCGFFYKKYF